MLRCTLAEMGVDARVLRVSLALPLLPHAAGGAPWMALGEAAQGPRPGLLIRVTARLPTESLAELLSPSERVVTLRYLTGQSHVEIATARAVAPRTIANQLALSFKKNSAPARCYFTTAGERRAIRLSAPFRTSWIESHSLRDVGGG